MLQSETLEESAPLRAEHVPSRLLTVREFHQALDGKVGLNALYGLVKEGRIRSVRVGPRNILVPSSELVDWPRREMERVS